MGHGAWEFHGKGSCIMSRIDTVDVSESCCTKKFSLGVLNLVIVQNTVYCSRTKSFMHEKWWHENFMCKISLSCMEIVYFHA